MAKVGVLGAGSWGTALAILLHDNGHDVTVWSYQEEEVRMLSEKREHVSKLPDMTRLSHHVRFYIKAVPALFPSFRLRSHLLLP